MAYHITHIINNSPRSVVITNPAPKSDTGWKDNRLVIPDLDYVPERPILVNQIPGNMVPYLTAVPKALNIYTMRNNWCFWDHPNDQVFAVAEDRPEEMLVWFNGGAGNLAIRIGADGTPTVYRP